MSNPAPRHVIILAQRDEDGTVTLHDANGKARVMETMGDYAKSIQEILDDTTLPEFQDVAPSQHNIEQAVVAGVQDSVPPYLRPFLTPLMGQVKSFLTKVSAARQTPHRPHPRGKRRTRRPKGRAA